MGVLVGIFNYVKKLFNFGILVDFKLFEHFRMDFPEVFGYDELIFFVVRDFLFLEPLIAAVVCNAGEICDNLRNQHPDKDGVIFTNFG